MESGCLTVFCLIFAELKFCLKNTQLDHKCYDSASILWTARWLCGGIDMLDWWPKATVVVVSCVTSWPCAAFTTNKHLPRSFLLQINMESMVSAVTKMCLQQACDKKRRCAEARKHFLQVGFLCLLQEMIKKGDIQGQNSHVLSSCGHVQTYFINR